MEMFKFILSIIVICFLIGFLFHIGGTLIVMLLIIAGIYFVFDYISKMRK